RSTPTDATKRFFKKLPARSGTRKTSFPSHFWHNACRCGCCVKMFETVRHYSSAELVSWRHRTLTFIKNLRANMCGTYGTAGGRIGMSCKDSFCQPTHGG